jgi:hypothetical protein
MTDLIIHLDVEAFSVPRNAEKGTAPVWLEIDGKMFPEARWDDFALCVLPEWSAELIPVLNSTEKQVIALPFFEGDYGVIMEADRDHIYEIKAGRWDKIDRHFDKPEIEISANIKTIDFASHLYAVSRQVIDYYMANDMRSGYLAAVIRWTDKLRSALAAL